MHEVLVNRLGGLSLPRKSVVRLTDRPDMTLDVYRGRKTTNQQQQLSYGVEPNQTASKVLNIGASCAIQYISGACGPDKRILQKVSYRD